MTYVENYDLSRIFSHYIQNAVIAGSDAQDLFLFIGHALHNLMIGRVWIASKRVNLILNLATMLFRNRL